MNGGLKLGYYEYKKITNNVIKGSDINLNSTFDVKSYARYILSQGTIQDKSHLIKGLGIPLYLYKGMVCTEPLV